MALKIAIVGLPNVGKSTLFNALTGTKGAKIANYPFCTIDPNVGIVEVPDDRLKKLAEISKSEKIIPAAIEFVDIAGLVKGASTGEGLGNKFLSNIRECNAIAHVIRLFQDPNVTHVHGEIDPKLDREVIESELLLADLQTMEKRLDKAITESRSGDKEKKAYADLLTMVNAKLNEGVLLSSLGLEPKQMEQLRDLHLLTLKPHLYVINVSEDKLTDQDRKQFAQALGLDDINKVIPICAKVEEELGGVKMEEAQEYLNDLGISDTGLNNLIRSAYGTLGLITYFTSGPKETRAWTIKNGQLAPQAAGTIHTDFETGFIKAEVVHADHLIEHGGEAKAKEMGKLRIEGKEYLVKDGDVMHFRFNN